MGVISDGKNEHQLCFEKFIYITVGSTGVTPDIMVMYLHDVNEQALVYALCTIERTNLGSVYNYVSS